MGTPYVENFVKTLLRTRASEFAEVRRQRDSNRAASRLSRTEPLPASDSGYAKIHSSLQKDLYSMNQTSTLDSQRGSPFSPFYC